MSEQKKLLWLKIIGLFISTIILIILYFSSCNLKLNRCFWGNDILFSRTLFHICLSMGTIFLFSFLISIKTFKKWLTFAAIWFLVDVIWIMKSPVISHYEFDIIPSTKEAVSVWMGSLFVIISLVMFIVLTIKEKKAQK